jgi:hypothetical protein
LINDYDPVQAWEKVTCPLLAILGEFDTNTPVPETAALMRKALEKAGNKYVAIEVFPKAEHTLFVRHETSDPWEWPRFANGYLDTQINWLLKREDVVK